MRRFGPWFILAALIVLCLAALKWPVGYRAVLRTRDGAFQYARPIKENETLWILYRHSVNRGEVQDGFTLEEGRLVLRRCRFENYGAGMPEPAEGQVFTVHDDYFELDGYDQPFDTVWTYVGRVADHRFRVGEDGEIVHFDALAAPGQALGLSVEKWSLLREIEWRLCRFEQENETHDLNAQVS